MAQKLGWQIADFSACLDLRCSGLVMHGTIDHYKRSVYAEQWYHTCVG
jgi:hypothetical protein